MIPAKNNRSFETTVAPIETADYTFDQSDLRHIAEVLRTMYSDPERAVVREYGANAVDAHRLVGKTGVPFDLHAPTLDEPFIFFRDYGPGLSKDDVKKLLLGYGASGKRGNNEDIGGFGIGAKCGYAISDQFTFTSYFDEKCQVWHCYLNEDGDCKADLVAHQDSTEPNGISVNIPVRLDSIDKFHTTIESAFLFFQTRPNIIGPDQLRDRVNRKLPNPFLQGEFTMKDRAGAEGLVKWEAIKDPDYNDRVSRGDTVSDLAFARIVMGGVSYPINLEILGDEFTNNDMFLRRLVIHVPVGFIQLAPSREALTYTPRVTGALKFIINAILENATANVKKEIHDTKNTCRQRLDLYGSLTSIIGGGTKKLDEELEKKYHISKKDGFILIAEAQTAVKEVVRYLHNNRYFNGRGYCDYYKTSRTAASTNRMLIDSNPDRAIAVECESTVTDVELGTAVKDLLSPSYTNSFEVIRVLPSCSDALKASCPWISDGSVALVKYSDLKAGSAETVALFEFKEQVRTSTAGSSGRYTYSQHSKKFVKLKAEVENYGTQSDNWEAIKVKELPATRKIYVVIDEFRIMQNYGNSKSQIFVMGRDNLANRRATHEFRTLVDELKQHKAFSELNDGIYAIRIGDAPDIEGDPEFIYFWDYVKERIESLVTEKTITRESLRVAWELCGIRSAEILISLILVQSYFWEASVPDFYKGDCELAKARTGFQNILTPAVADQFIEKVMQPLHHFIEDAYREHELHDLDWLTGKAVTVAHWREENHSTHQREYKHFHPCIKALVKQIQKTTVYKALIEISEEEHDSYEIGAKNFWGFGQMKHLTAEMWLREGRAVK